MAKYSWETALHLAEEIQVRDLKAANKTILSLVESVNSKSGNSSFEEVKLRILQILTIARRYGLSSMIGLVTEDDDANLACKRDILEHPDQGGRDSNISSTASIKSQHHSFGSNPKQNNIMDNLPRIDGVNYQQQKAKDGTIYVTASGNIRNKNSILKEAGFKWNVSRKLWWKAA